MTHVARNPRQPDPAVSGTEAGLERPLVLFASPVADLKGGAERVLLNLLANPAIRPALAVPGEGELAEIARQRGLPLRFINLGAVAAVHRPPRPRDLLRAANEGRRCAGQLAAAVKDTGASLLHTNGLKVHVIGALSRLAHRVPVVAHLHDIPHTGLEKAIWRGIAAGATRTVLVSEPCYPGPLPSRAAVVANGVQPTAAPCARTLSEAPVIGFVGRIHPFKGLHLLLDWFEQASAARPALRLLIRGRAEQEGADYWASLQGQVSRLVGQGRCRVLGWAGPGEDPYAGMDLLAVPSQTPDPAPLVVVEAMLRGIPPIGYPAGGIPALIGGPEHGALAADAAGFEAALTRLLDPRTYGLVSAAGARRVRGTFSMERFWANINAQYALAGLAMPRQPDQQPDQQAGRR